MIKGLGLGMLREVRLVATVCAGLALFAACDESSPESVVPASGAVPVADDTSSGTAAAPTTERAKTSYRPVGPEGEALGELVVLGPPGGVGSLRTFQFANGGVIELELLSGLDVSKPIGSQPAAAALGLTVQALQNGGDPKVYLLKVLSETPPAGAANLCGDKPAPFAVVRQPESETDKTLTLVMVAGAVDDPSAAPCHKSVYVSG